MEADFLLGQITRKDSAMLVLGRFEGETVLIGNDIKVTVLQFRGNQIRLGFEAPENVSIVRGELLGREKQQQIVQRDGDELSGVE